MNSQDIGQLIDLERYPLDRPDEPRYRDLLDELHQTLPGPNLPGTV